MNKQFVEVAVPTPLLSTFDYLLPAELAHSSEVRPGARVKVPFGHRQLVAVVVVLKSETDCPPARLKSVMEVLDTEPLLPEDALQLLTWASGYYHYPVGEVLSNALPKWLREGRSTEQAAEEFYAITSAGEVALSVGDNRAPKQIQLLQTVAQYEQAVSYQQLREQGFDRAGLKRVLEKNWLTIAEQVPVKKTTGSVLRQAGLDLNQQQKKSVDAIAAAKHFASFLLQGVTGSGKTEVYLQAIERILQQGKQALVLVPEIGLTPQTISRFESRFSVSIACLHSALTDSQRMQSWLQARAGDAKIVIGTRSALFVPLPHLGLIIIDEEHDSSFRQHSGFRYVARDMAMMRAKMMDVPIVLGSATPSLESLANVERKKYHLLRLDQRVAGGELPQWKIIDVRDQSLKAGMSSQLLERMRYHLDNNGQVLIFLNRRGYAPVLMCHHCGFSQQCDHCDAHMTLHARPSRMYCHHCGASSRVKKMCPSCQQSDMSAVGLGTEQLELMLQQQFPEQTVLRLDRDTTRGKGSMAELLQQAHHKKAQILVGTQMLAKGHHFPAMSLVGIINADNGLMSSDFRALEQMGQLCCQVAGRAGRENSRGEVLIQTHQPDHVLLQSLVRDGYEKFAQQLLHERQDAQLPPYSYLAKWVVNDLSQQAAFDAAQKIQQLAQVSLSTFAVKCFGPMPAIMERVADRYHVEVVCLSSNRQQLQRFLSKIYPEVSRLKFNKGLRWFLQVD
ncbi:MAG: primosomal protein N' [Coxiellaceae bacterium]|nr:primosomal protein N' [Coxiellaceae bacterium]